MVVAIYQPSAEQVLGQRRVCDSLIIYKTVAARCRYIVCPPYGLDYDISQTALQDGVQVLAPGMNVSMFSMMRCV